MEDLWIQNQFQFSKNAFSVYTAFEKIGFILVLFWPEKAVIICQVYSTYTTHTLTDQNLFAFRIHSHINRRTLSVWSFIRHWYQLGSKQKRVLADHYKIWSTYKLFAHATSEFLTPNVLFLFSRKMNYFNHHDLSDTHLMLEFSQLFLEKWTNWDTFRSCLRHISVIN